MLGPMFSEGKGKWVVSEGGRPFRPVNREEKVEMYSLTHQHQFWGAKIHTAGDGNRGRMEEVVYFIKEDLINIFQKKIFDCNFVLKRLFLVLICLNYLLILPVNEMINLEFLIPINSSAIPKIKNTTTFVNILSMKS